ncbi:hypothetical protein [Vogesella sp. LIG4]|uniref:hypothetical protein n=1 Tax=Vogesella sp. LIG4 TaxID=1192162 RepID=UPI001390496D|nr:hypothetical protein [Vogesella sp. LIG4]
MKTVDEFESQHEDNGKNEGNCQGRVESREQFQHDLGCSDLESRDSWGCNMTRQVLVINFLSAVGNLPESGLSALTKGYLESLQVFDAKRKKPLRRKP